MSLLQVQDINVGYDDLQILWDVSIEVEADESVIAIVGPNGAGKTTLLKTLSGLLTPSSGRVIFNGKDTGDIPATDIVKEGFVHVSEERNLFGDLNVYQNLRMGAFLERENFDDRLEEVFTMFPVLEERRNQKAKTLSGGEQQMLAIGRGLMAGPELLALDEPSGALAPQLVDRVLEKVENISEDIPVLLVEQHVDRALELADRAYLLENGRIVASADADELLESDHVVDAYLRGTSA